MDWKFVLVLIFAVIVAVFAIQNAEVVDIQFLNMEWPVSQALVILFSAMLGALIVLMLSIIRWVKYSSKVKSSTKTIAALEDENKKLKLVIETNKKQEAATTATGTAADAAMDQA